MDKFHIKDGDLLLENAKFTTVKTGRGRNLAPIAIASVSASGLLTGGTSNVTVSNYGQWVDIGEENKGVQAIVTPVSSTIKAYPVVNLLGAPNNTKIEVKFYDFNGYQYYPGYSMVVYKTGTDAYREYNITMADDTNGVVITHGNFGISTAAVDSLRITILVPDSVTIGGSGLNGAGITFSGLPASTSIKITNYGKILGMGGQGGRGGGTYASYQGGCSITEGVGYTGGSAILTNNKLIVDNYGFIGAGGGGGGGGKKGAVSQANGGGGGAGAGWPIGSGTPSNGYGNGGSGGVTAYAVSQGNECSFGNTCTSSIGCCCGFYGPYGENGHVGTFTTGINFIAGTGGAGINGAYTGATGAVLGGTGQSNGNTAGGGPPGKAIIANVPTGAGNIINNLSGGQTIGVVD